MAYTPIGWQTGDTITAEKLNKMDNGWSVGATEKVLFDGTVTTSESSGHNTGNISTESAIAADTIIVTFNGTRYECPNISGSGGYEYGAVYGEVMDFSIFPFNIYAGNDSVEVITENAGTYPLKIEATGKTVDISDDFKEAVAESVGAKILRCIEGTTNITDVQNFFNNGGIVYFTAPDTAGGTDKHLYFINTPGNPCTIFPESTTLTAIFSRDDGSFNIIYKEG